MKNIRLLWIVFFGFASHITFAQSEKAENTFAKFRAYAISSSTHNSISEKWNDWGEWEKINEVLILFDFEKERLTIFTEKRQEYDIYEKIKKKGEEELIDLRAIDENGDNSRLSIVCPDVEKSELHLYILIGNNHWVYSIERI
jgi:hypothetical protein